MITSQMRRAPYTKAAAGGPFNSFHSILLSFTATASFALATLSQVSRLTFCAGSLIRVNKVTVVLVADVGPKIIQDSFHGR